MTASCAVEFELPALLEKAGARLIGRNRANCTRCGGHRTITYSDEVFICHRCGFRGNAYTLARELGCVRRLSPEERIRQQRERELARVAASIAYEQIRARRWALYEDRRQLLNIFMGASDRLRHNWGDELAWDGLAYAYRRLDQDRAELLLLEDGPFVDVLEFLRATPPEREKRLWKVILEGGIVNRQGKFIELGAAALGTRFAGG